MINPNNNGHQSAVLDGSVRTPTTREELNELLKARGKLVQDMNTFRFEGNTNIGPEAYTGKPERYRNFVNKWADDEQSQHDFQKEYDCLFGDGAVALNAVCMQLGGFVASSTMFSNPKFGAIRTGPNPGDEVQVPIGEIEIPMLECKLTMLSPNGRFALQVTTKKSNVDMVVGLLALIEDYIAENSIYKGKPIQVGDKGQITFIHVADIDPNSVFYNDDTRAQIKANIWTMMTKPDQVLAAGMDLKQLALFEGDYGTGKSLAVAITAKIAIECGLTYIDVKPGMSIIKAYEIADLLGKCFISIEEIDTFINDDATESAELLNVLDGTRTKGKSWITAMTTNHPDVLQAGQWRPGRMGALVRFGELTPDKSILLFKHSLGDQCGVQEHEWADLMDKLKWMTGAYVKGTADKAHLYRIADGRDKISAADLLFAARELEPQYENQKSAKSYSHDNTSGIDKILGKMLQTAVEGTLTGTHQMLHETGNQIQSSVCGKVDSVGLVTNSNMGELGKSLLQQLTTIATTVGAPVTN